MIKKYQANSLILTNVLNVTISPKSHCCNSKPCCDRGDKRESNNYIQVTPLFYSIIVLTPFTSPFPNANVKQPICLLILAEFLILQ